MKPYLKTKLLIHTALMCAVLAVCSQLLLPLPTGGPVTLQTFAVALAGFLLGKKQGLICYSIYILLGICSAPVFSGFSGGASRLVSVTGGFLTGFYFIVFFSGLAKDRGRIFCLISSVISVLLCHMCGIIQFSFLTKTDILKSFLSVSAPFIIKDILSFVFAYFLAKKIQKR